MIASFHPAARLVALLLGSVGAFAPASVLAQTPALPYMNRNLIVLDPAHGGQDSGANLNGQPEKEATLALATALKTELTTRGFTVVLTRDADLPATAPPLTPDQRAGIANHLRPVACILLHATETGAGVHLLTSPLPPAPDPYDAATPLPWETAQATYLSQSQRLANDLGLALVHARIPALLTRATLRPLDNLTCPALAIEVAPANHQHAGNAAYQQRLAETLAAALLTWRDTTAPRPTPKPAPAPTSAVTP